jgi:hypothetical protein
MTPVGWVAAAVVVAVPLGLVLIVSGTSKKKDAHAT